MVSAKFPTGSHFLKNLPNLLRFPVVSVAQPSNDVYFSEIKLAIFEKVNQKGISQIFSSVACGPS
jgi:hypothetical protein